MLRRSTHRAGHDIRRFQRNREGLERHRSVVIEELAAEGEEFGAGGGAADLVEELTGRLHAEADDVHILLHIV